MFLLSFASFTFPVSSNSNPTVKLLHEIEIKNGGLLIVNDTVIIENDGNEPLNTFKIGLPSGFIENLDHVSVRSSDDQLLDFVEDVDFGVEGIYGFEVNLPRSVDVGETFNFTMTCVFSELIWSESAYAIYIAIFPKYPSLQYEAAECNSTIILPEEVNVYDSIWRLNGAVAKTNYTQPLPAYMNQTGFISFSDPIHIIACEWAMREIIIDSSAQITFKDTYHLTNLGRSVLPSLTFMLPGDADNIIAYDTFFGEITVTSGTSQINTIATVAFRHPGITPAYLGLTPPGNYTFTISYKLPANTYLDQLDTWNYRFETLFFENFEYTVKDLTVKIVLPEGGEFISYSNSEGKISKTGYQEILIYELKDVTPFDDMDVTVEYTYLIFWSAFRPVLWLGLAIILVGAVVMIKRRGRPPTPPLSVKDVRVIRAFINVNNETTALRSELKSLEKDLERRRIQKKRYKRRRGIILQQLRSLDREHSVLKREIISKEPSLREAIHQIEVAETELETVRLNTNKLRTQYRSGRISKKAYEELLKEYEKRSDRAQTKVDEAIMRLQREL